MKVLQQSSYYPSRTRDKSLPSPPASLWDSPYQEDDEDHPPPPSGNYTIDHHPIFPSSPSDDHRTHACSQCGKTYKLASCLTKHLWEHSEGWALTQTLPLSKHQQVQMLEAASILMGMSTRAIYDDNDDDSNEVIRIVDDDLP
ncbi:hypothetical protein [Absidia glauca]|uniref:C2H2-type domain-containing protein n=1 Tax=Absidia glauca TaxID=4829 RepID=A0A168QD86_ABSGL|nr:hypothetical protein [Absidia glauca]